MRALLLLAVVAVGCDSGATAAPHTAPPAPPTIPAPARYEAYTVRDNTDLVAKAHVLLGDMLELFPTGAQPDCARIAERIETFGAENHTRFGVLMAYSKAHPEVDKLVQEAVKPEVDALIARLTPLLTACASDRRWLASFEKLAADMNVQPQRPR